MEVFTLQFDVFVLLFSLAFTLSHSQPLFLLLFSQDCFCSVTKKIDCFCSVSVLYSLTLSLFLLVYIIITQAHTRSLYSLTFLVFALTLILLTLIDVGLYVYVN